ncbi:MAG: hypothetical protein AAGK78_08585, partial [Planctomycetota bacterium]
RQAERVVNRRAIDLMMRGLPRDKVEGNLEKLKEGSEPEAERELKMFFILNTVAEEKGITVDEAEVNGEIAMQAINQGQRPETLKKRMEQDGSLNNLYTQMREHKALDALAEDAKIEEFEPSAEETKEHVAAATGEETEGGDEADIT